MKTAIIIPVYKLWEKMTAPCLAALAEYTDKEKIHVYLVDNASDDETQDQAPETGKNLFGSGFTYIRNMENSGFSKACNQGAEKAREDGCELLFFLNNDTKVTGNWLEPLLAEMENPRIGAVGPLLLYPDDTVQHCGVVFDCFSAPRYYYRYFPKNHQQVGKKRKFRAITGAALLCRVKDFFAAGRFNEEYKNGFEDLELCLNFVRMGMICEVVPQSVVYHYEGQTPARHNKEAVQHNVNIFYDRNKDIVCDALTYYAKDGYLPALTKDFMFYVRLSEEKRRELNRQAAENCSEEFYLSLLSQEPFWHDGYHLLAEKYAAENNFERALLILDKSMKQCSRRETFEKMAALVRRFGDSEAVRQYEQKLAAMTATYELSGKVNAEKLKRICYGTKFYDMLLQSRELDTDDFGKF